MPSVRGLMKLRVAAEAGDVERQRVAPARGREDRVVDRVVDVARADLADRPLAPFADEQRVLQERIALLIGLGGKRGRSARFRRAGSSTRSTSRSSSNTYLYCVPGSVTYCYWLAAGLCRPRGGRAAHREGEAQPLLGRAARRDREGAPGSVQHPAAGVRGRPPDRRPRQPGELQEHDHHHDVEHRRPLHPEEGVARVPVDRRQRDQPQRQRHGARRGAEDVQPRVHQPHRRDHRVRGAVGRRPADASRGCWSSR